MGDRENLLPGCIFTLVLIIICLFSSSVKAHALTSPWLESTPPTLEKLNSVGLNDPQIPFLSSNQSCQQREVITRPYRLLPYPQTKQSNMSCVVDTNYGAFSTSGYLQRPGSTVSGNIKTTYGGSTLFVPIPYSNIGLTMSSDSSYGYRLLFWDNLDANLKSSVIYDGQVTHNLPATSPVSLRDGAGNLLLGSSESMSFSANGDWMVVDVPFIAMSRINTKTRQVLPFGTAINYNIGLGPGYRTAISPDGNYAIVASSNFEILRIYDLTTCGAVPANITGKVNCNSKDLLPFFKQTIEGFSNIESVRFRSDFTLELYAKTKLSNITTISRYILTAPGQTTTDFQYLALGDSFSAGEGAYQYKAMTDTSTNKCHLSLRSYPYLISSILGFGKYESVACSGAKIDDILRTDDDYTLKKSQAKNKPDPSFNEEIFSNFLPGYRAQNLFLLRYQPQIITISTAGNDIGFTDKIIRCIDSDTCYSKYEDRLEIVKEINSQYYRLVDMYTQLKDSGNPHAKIYVIGYPQIGDPDGNCALNVHLNHDELLFSNQLVSYLNTVVKTAADNAGVAYIDVEDSLAGHKLCETNSWAVAVNGLTAGNDIVSLPLAKGPIGNESFHPNALGQELMKNKILERSNNLTKEMPQPQPNLTIADPTDDLAILNAPKSNRNVRMLRKVSGTNGGVIQIGKTWLWNYSGLKAFVKAPGTVHGWLNSTPVDLGDFPVDSSGNMSVQTNLTSSVSPGVHTIHFYGKNSIGEDVDLYETVSVTTEQASTCGVVAESGQDADKDGVDDACDPLIAQAPVEIIPEPVMPPQVIVINPPVVPIVPPVVIAPVEPTPTPPIISPLPPEPIAIAPVVDNPTTSPINISLPDSPSTTASPKPIQPNPETVAGHESVVIVSSNQSSALTQQTEQSPQSPTYQVANEPSPQVQGANTQPDQSISPPQSTDLKTTATTTPPINSQNKFWPYLSALTALSISIFLYSPHSVKLFRKP